jgi:hypothetical protein
VPWSSCPIAARFIDTCDDARAYYAFRLVGEHPVSVGGVSLVVRFNREETHLFTDTRNPCPPGDVVRRLGVSGEVRCFAVERARLLDLILPTIKAPVVALRANIPGGVMLLGPPDPASARRLCVVVAPASREPGIWFVRTAYPMSPRDFAAARRGRATPWPPR